MSAITMLNGKKDGNDWISEIINNLTQGKQMKI